MYRNREVEYILRHLKEGKKGKRKSEMKIKREKERTNEKQDKYGEGEAERILKNALAQIVICSRVVY